MSRPRYVGLPWYSLEHYDVLRRDLADGAKLPKQYEVWLVSAEQVEREVQRSGVEVVRVSIEPDAFTAWCERTGSTSDVLARARFAMDFVKEPTVS